MIIDTLPTQNVPALTQSLNRTQPLPANLHTDKPCCFCDETHLTHRDPQSGEYVCLSCLRDEFIPWYQAQLAASRIALTQLALHSQK